MSCSEKNLTLYVMLKEKKNRLFTSDLDQKFQNFDELGYPIKENFTIPKLSI